MPVHDGIYYTISEGETSKPAIILLHGAGGDYLNWPVSLRRLSGYRVVSLDLPGHGRSTQLSVQHQISSYVKMLISLIHKEEIYKAILIGHSMGGGISLNVALEYPQLVSRMVLISSGASFEISNDILGLLSNPSTARAAMELLRLRAFSPKTPASIVQRSMKALLNVRSGVLYGDWLACSQFDLREQVAHITCPTQVIVGADDNLTPVSYAHFLSRRMPNVTISLIRDAGHMVILEKPEEVEKSILAFLNYDTEIVR